MRRGSRRSADTAKSRQPSAVRACATTGGPRGTNGADSATTTTREHPVHRRSAQRPSRRCTSSLRSRRWTRPNSVQLAKNAACFLLFGAVRFGEVDEHGRVELLQTPRRVQLVDERRCRSSVTCGLSPERRGDQPRRPGQGCEPQMVGAPRAGRRDTVPTRGSQNRAPIAVMSWCGIRRVPALLWQSEKARADGVIDPRGQDRLHGDHRRGVESIGLVYDDLG